VSGLVFTPLAANIKSALVKKIKQYEGRFNHLYLDTKGKVTVGVGHLIPNRNAIATVTLYKVKNKLPSQVASLVKKQAEYDKISKLPYGQRYGASSFKSHTMLVIKDSDINTQRDKHISCFYTELTSAVRANNFPSKLDEDFIYQLPAAITPLLSKSEFLQRQSLSVRSYDASTQITVEKIISSNCLQKRVKFI
jgi:hypothetical protein